MEICLAVFGRTDTRDEANRHIVAAFVTITWECAKEHTVGTHCCNLVYGMYSLSK